MDLIADILLIAGALGAAFYCIVLSRRLSRFNDLEKGVGGAVAVLSTQVDEMTNALAQAQGSANGSTDTLESLTIRAEDVAKRLELLVASMHDIPANETSGKQETSKEPVFKSKPKPDQALELKSQFRSARAYKEDFAA